MRKPLKIVLLVLLGFLFLFGNYLFIGWLLSWMVPEAVALLYFDFLLMLGFAKLA